MLLTSSPSFFDRYTMPFVFLFLLLLSDYLKFLSTKTTTIFVLFYILFFFCFSILGTREYFEWNRIRKMAHEDLTKAYNLKPTEIHAGIDYNAWLTYSHSNPKKWKNDLDLGNQAYIFAFTKNFYPYRVYKSYSFFRPFVANYDTVFVLKR